MPKSTFSDYAHVAYQIKGNDVSEYLPFHKPMTPLMGIKGQLFFFSESGHCVYKISGNEA